MDSYALKKWGINCEQFTSVLFSFMLRMQPWLKKRVEETTKNAFIDSFNIQKMNRTTFFHPSKAMSLPIRWGDK